MNKLSPTQIAEAATSQARALGADLAGIAAWTDVMAGPSLQTQPMLSAYSGVGVVKQVKQQEGQLQPGSLLIVGLAHPVGRLELDYWQEHLPRRTLGNDLLADITDGVAEWLGAEHGIPAWDLPYYPSRGGVYLKDAAVLAGLGCVGRNNLFIAPRHGPRLRLRAMALEPALASSGAVEFDPCPDCDAPCRKACPQDAMAEPWLADLTGPSHLPARDGSYDRKRCNGQMQADIADHRMITPPDSGASSKQVRYCRRCELACVAGRASSVKS